MFLLIFPNNRLGIIFVLIILIYKSSKLVPKISIAFAIIHFIYTLLEILSPDGKYLCNKNSSEDMYQKMGKYFKKEQKIIFSCECYRGEQKHYTTTDKLGRAQLHTKTVKVITYTENYEMTSYSERDVSGLFYLNYDKAMAKQKRFIKLKLKEEINFADPISIMDYHNEIEKFYARNRYKDIYLEFKEQRLIPAMIHHTLIKLGDNDPFLLNYFFLYCLLY